MKPVVVLSSVEHSCVTFVWPNDRHFHVGYRFVEHRPRTTQNPLPHSELKKSRIPAPAGGQYSQSGDWLENWQTAFSEPDHPLHLNYQTFSDGSALANIVENEGAQERTWRFVPDDEGVRLWMTLKTSETIPGGYIIQQCLRLTSGIGFGFYPQVARIPFLSELLMQVLGNANGTLTWTRMNDAWHRFPVPFTRYNLAASQDIFEDSRGQADSSLILRESASRAEAPDAYWQSVAPDADWETMTAGFYWERAAFISNRHPADCLHIGIDFGPLEAGESRTVSGKFYWIAGTKDDLLSLWHKDFSARSDLN
jgi:hypothetical protein